MKLVRQEAFLIIPCSPNLKKEIRCQLGIVEMGLHGRNFKVAGKAFQNYLPQTTSVDFCPFFRT